MSDRVWLPQVYLEEGRSWSMRETNLKLRRDPKGLMTI